MTAAQPRVQPDSYLTLHYRVSLPETGSDVVSTFGGYPATLQLGVGQMAEPLERCLLGLGEGEKARFELEPAAAFGLRSPKLVQTVPSARLRSTNLSDPAIRPGDLVELEAPDGQRISGVLKEVDGARALLDFNHPLAGQPIALEVEILGIL